MNPAEDFFSIFQGNDASHYTWTPGTSPWQWAGLSVSSRGHKTGGKMFRMRDRDHDRDDDERDDRRDSEVKEFDPHADPPESDDDELAAEHDMWEEIERAHEAEMEKDG